MSRKKFMEMVAKHGATVDDDDETLWVDAPTGKRWSEGSIHVLVAPYRNICGESWKREAYAELIERMEYGLEDCDDSDCDICEQKEMMGNER